MASVPPLMKGIYLCDEVFADPTSRKISLLNVFITARPEESSFPFELGKLCVVTALRGGRGQVRVRVDVVRESTNTLIFRTAERDLHFFTPLTTIYARFGLMKVRFPSPGRYAVEIHCDGVFLDDEVLTILPVEKE